MDREVVALCGGFPALGVGQADWCPLRTGMRNLVEIIWLELADDVQLVIHAMDLRPLFHDLLPTGEDPT